MSFLDNLVRRYAYLKDAGREEILTEKLHVVEQNILEIDLKATATLKATSEAERRNEELRLLYM